MYLLSSWMSCYLGCGGLISQNAIFSSPGYPTSLYKDRLNCNWLIERSGNYKITLLFTSIVTESCCDFVYVYDYVNGIERLMNSRYSGSHSQVILKSTGNKMKVTFTSDGSVQAAGFIAQVSFGKCIILSRLNKVSYCITNPNSTYVDCK